MLRGRVLIAATGASREGVVRTSSVSRLRVYLGRIVEAISAKLSPLVFPRTTPTPAAYHFVSGGESGRREVSSTWIEVSKRPAGTRTSTPTFFTVTVSSTLGNRSSGLKLSPTLGLAGMNTAGICAFPASGGSLGIVGPPTSQLPSWLVTMPLSYLSTSSPK